MLLSVSSQPKAAFGHMYLIFQKNHYKAESFSWWDRYICKEFHLFNPCPTHGSIITLDILQDKEIKSGVKREMNDLTRRLALQFQTQISVWG